VLVIGVGSLVRTDDAVGRVVVDRLKDLALPGVEVASLHQLTPEVGARLAGRRLVVFVDAAVDVDGLTVTPLATDASGRLVTHHLGAAGLLRLAADLGWAPDAAALVRVPASNLGIGTELSPAAAGLVDGAVAEVRALVDDAAVGRGGRAGRADGGGPAVGQ
jgi:hydrogenase maturation protease